MGGHRGNVDHAVFHAQAGRLPRGAFQFPFPMVGGVIETQGQLHMVMPGGPVQGHAGVQAPAEQHGCFHLVHGGALKGTVFRVVFRHGGQLDAAAGGKTAFHLQPAGGDGGHQVVRDAVDDLFVKGGIVAVGGQIIFEGLGFHAVLVRNVNDRQVAGVRLPGDGAQGGKLVRVQRDGVGPRAAVGEGLQLGVVRAGEEGTLGTEEGQMVVRHG